MNSSVETRYQFLDEDVVNFLAKVPPRFKYKGLLGDKLGVGAQLSTGVVIVLGVRIFSNVAAIRRHIFKA